MSLTRATVLIFSFVSILLCGASPIKQKSDGSIILHNEKINFIPHEFYIADIADERNDRSAVASLIENNLDHSQVAKRVDLKDGAIVSIKNFISQNLHRDTLLRPVIVTLKEFKLNESNLPDGRISGRLDIIFSFALQKSYGTVHLVDYTGGTRYERPGNQPADAEAILRQGIERALSYFNTWINNNVGSSVLLARKVKVNFTDYTEKPEGDTIYYSANRPLTWNDFQDKPRDGRFEAEVFTTIGYIERNKVAKGIIYVDIAIKVDVAKSDCWVRGGGRDNYVLNHEQRHFDIEKIVSEHFKQKILAMELPVDNFDGPINVEYLETLREATRMQKQYDTETGHGQDRPAQEQWNEKIDKELKVLGIRK